MQIPRIKKLYYNKTTCDDPNYDGEDFTIAEVGTDKVEDIKEHLPQGEGDRLYYDVVVAGKLNKRIFYPSHVEYFG